MAVARVQINDAALNELLRGPGGAVVNYMNDLGREVRNEAVRRCPVDEGRLRSSIQNTTTVDGNMITTRVGTNVEYALFVHNGTGIYGPAGKRIEVSPGKKAMRFMPKKGGKPGTGKGGAVFVKWVSGSRANPFLTDALRAVLQPKGWPIIYRRPTGGPKG